MKSTTQLRRTDYDKLLQLAGELGALPHDAAMRRRHAMLFMRSMMQSRSAMFVQTGFKRGKYRLLAPVLVGLEDAPRSVVQDYFASKLPFDPCAPLMERATPNGTFTATRRMLVPDRVWYGGDYSDAVARPLHVNDGVYSRVVSKRGQVFGIALLRGPGEKPMQERQRQMLWAFSEHVAPLCLLDEVEHPDLSDLPPRYRSLMRRYLAGDSSKQAAVKLGLSIHTVREYSKRLHRLFGVNTRTELVTRLLNRPA